MNLEKGFSVESGKEAVEDRRCSYYFAINSQERIPSIINTQK